MVKLPTLQPRGAVIRGPQSSVSGAEVANPFQQIASGFDALGEFAQKKALDDARIEGQQEVERDANGTPIVTSRSNWTEAGRTYNRVHHQQVMAQTEIGTRQAMSKLQEEARGNPDAFRASAKAYRDQTMISIPRELRGPVGTMLDGEIAANQIGVENQKYRSDMTSAKSVLLESLNLAENDRAALARQGGVDTKEYRDAYAKTRTLWNELSAEPAFGISPREAEIKLKAAQDRDSGEAILGEADRALDVGGIAEARRLADNILTSTAVSLSPSERRKYSGLINQSIKSYQSEQRAAVLPLKDLAKDRVKEWEAGIGLDSTDDAMLIENIRKGDPSYASYLTSRLTSARQVRDVRNLGDRAQVKLLEETAGRFAPEEITVAKTFLKGRTDKDATHIDGMQDAFAVKLSRMFEAAPPEIKAGLGVYSGARSVERQRELWQQALAKYGSVDEARRWVAPPGNSQHNHGNAADLSYNGQSLKNAPANVVAWLHENANSYGLKFPLSNENWHIEDDSTRGGKSIPLVGAAAKTLQSEVAADLRRDLGDWETRLKRGDVPDQDSLNLMTRQLALVDDQDLRSQYQTMFRNSQAFQEGFQANPAAVESFLGSLDARAAGSGASLAELQILDSARAGAEAAATMKRNDGLGYAMRTYPNFPKMPMLDVNNPSSYETTLRQYQNGVNIAQAGGEMTNIPAFRPAQAQAVARMWQRGDASQLGALTDAFASSLNPETLRATLTTGPIKEALGGAILSTDPVKHQAAMQQLDLLSAKVSIPQLEADFGKDAVDRLQDWQAKVRYFTPEETADWLKQRNDPKWSDRTKPLVRKGEDEARKVSAADIIDKLDTNRWFDAAGPIDEQTRRWMMNDYVTLVGDRNASLDNVDTAKTQAIERMSKRWGVTSVYGDRGGRVMPYPPESYYPDVNGSKDWIGRELQGIAASRNIDISTLSLISDQKTEAAARAGEMPGYMMTAVDPKTGLEDLVTDEQGRPLRHFFDPRAAQGSILSDAQRARQNLGPAAVQQRIDETFARDPVPPGSFLLNQGSE